MPLSSDASRRFLVALVLALAPLCFAAAPPADPAMRHFHLPADEARTALKLFAEQSGLGLVVASETVRGIRTNAVHGTFTPRDALDRLLAGTPLVATTDTPSGAFAIRSRATDSFPNPNSALPMKPTRLAALLALVFTAPLGAQPAATTPATAAVGDTIVLNPFDVTAGATKGYMATNTISGTAMNTPLKEVPMAINVITAEFLADSLVGDFAQALDFNSAITQTSRQPTTNRSDSWSIRGFRNRNTLVDGVTAGEFIPPQMIDRIEVVKGPNTLYGQSDPGGLINVITKRPRARNAASLLTRAGDHGLRGTELDATVRGLGNRVGLRIIGATTRTNGYRIIDGSKTHFGGVAGDVHLTPNTTVLFHVSGSRTEGISSQRSTYSFQLIPTDLNGDGRIDGTLVNGIAENTARYNNNFLPRDYTSATGATRFEQENSFLQYGLRHRFGKFATVQYALVRTAQHLDMTFREYNTFNAAGSADANHSTNEHLNRTTAHSLNTLLSFSTGPLAHRMLVGGRYTWDLGSSTTYALRTLVATERPVLDRMIASGRKIRLFLTRADVLSGVPYWLDDTPTFDEMRMQGSRLSNVGRSDSRVGSVYATDSVSLLENRLKLLGGVRYIRIRSQSTDLNGVKLGVYNDQSRTSYQVGAVYDLTPAISAYANTATAFNPNGFDNLTGVFFEPELSRAYEVGLKTDEFWGGRIGGSISLFDINKKNVSRTDYNPVTFRNDNEITDDQSKGWETELFFNATKDWQTVINYSRIDAKVIVSRTLAKNLRLEGAAPHRFTLWTSYAVNRGPLKGLRFAGGAIVARGPIQQFGTSNSQLVQENGYTVINLFARYRTKIHERPFTFGVNVDNLNDTFFIRSRAGTNNPRQIVFSAQIEL